MVSATRWPRFNQRLGRAAERLVAPAVPERVLGPGVCSYAPYGGSTAHAGSSCALFVAMRRKLHTGLATAEDHPAAGVFASISAFSRSIAFAFCLRMYIRAAGACSFSANVPGSISSVKVTSVPSPAGSRV
jgi:hypothetical protein